jgi:SpoVK/Ycf46/Vps4 family AAA+-type ATPase
MPVDPSVIAAISAALSSDPDNTALRLHLGALYLEDGKPAEALEQYSVILAKQPDHLEALEKAAAAAEASGDSIRAHGYRRLHESLSWNRAKNLIDNLEPPTDEPEPLTAEEVVDSLARLGLDDQGPRVPVFESHDDRQQGAWDAERPEVTLKDVAGMNEVKRRLNVSFLAPLRNPDMMKLYGKSLRGGLLLYGPPGCGKTFIARATAGEIGARFVSVGLTDVVDMWLGQSEKNLHEIFETARRNRPCVLFFDEIDALGRKRSLARDSAGRGVINQLLSELDGANGDNDGVFVLAASNHPWDVDVALRRPGRLDRTLLVLPPDVAARSAIVESQLRARPIEKIDVPWIASKTEDFSGADLVHLCESAVELAMEDSLNSGTVRPIRMDDFKRALKEIRPSVRPWFDAARNYALFSNEGGVYDDLLAYLRARRLV